MLHHENFITTFDFMRILIVVCSLFVSTFLTAGTPRGFELHQRDAHTLDVVYQADTSSVYGPYTREHRSADGATRQIVVTADVIVPGPTNTSIELVQQTSLVHVGTSFPDRTRYAMELSHDPLPLAQPVTLQYLGVSGDRHIARVSIVVAEQRLNQPLAFHLRTSFRITFVGAQMQGKCPSTMLSVLNPQAPWWIPSMGRGQAKQSEQTQGSDLLSNVYALSIGEEGVYRLTKVQLQSAGIPVDASAARTLKVFGRGGMELPERVDSAVVNTLREQPILVRTAADGSINEIVFYASGLTGWAYASPTVSHYIHHYATKARYYLTYGGADGLRMQARAAATTSASIRPSFTVGRVFQEEELVNPYNYGSGRRWYGRSIENKGAISVSTVLPGFVPSGTVLYRYVLGQRSTSLGAFTLSDNGATVGQITVDRVPDYMDAFTNQGEGIIAADRLPSDGRSVLKIQYNSQDNSATGILDWFEIHYPRSLNAFENSYEFFAFDSTGTQEYSINGFSGEVFGFDVTDRSRPVLIENTSVTGGMFVVKEQISKGAPRRYMLSSALRATEITKIEFPNLRAKPRAADVIVIAHPALRESAEAFAEYRRSKGKLSTSVVTTEEIFAEFSFGMLDPTAIRDFLAMAYTTWTPRPQYAVLWGDGHYDYKNISSPATNYVIPYESLDPDNQAYGLTTYTTDDYYARIVKNDDQVDLAIGRVPVSSNAMGKAYLQKVRAYEEASSADDWRTRITLIADDGQAAEKDDGSLHLDQSEILSTKFVPQEFQAKKIYLVEYPTESVARGRRKPAATQEMLSTINTTGSVLLNWVGHGNPRVWAHEEIFRRETTPNDMLNPSKLFFLTAATCDFARYDMPETQSGAEEMLLKPDGGAVGVFSAARVVYSTANAALNESFYTHLFERDERGEYPTIGVAMYRVKQKFTSNNDEKFHLLGDPTLQLLVPDQRVRFTTINGRDIVSDSTPVTIPALGNVTIEGEVIGSLDTSTVKDFEGYITLSLLDANRVISIQDNNAGKTINTFTKPGPALYRGSFRVEGGKFIATFVVPKDITFSTNRAGLYGYAASKDFRYAMGMTNRVVVDGVTSVIDPETDGPAMQVFMDSRKFLPGGLVRMNPVLIVDLEDATGINTTGIGIGHDITASFDGDVEQVVLTPSFATSLTNSKAGTVMRQIFGLGHGVHTVKVRAWDVLNNVSECNTTFRIEEAKEGILAEGLFNFPNPFSTSTTIRYTHSSPRPFQATLMIFDLTGRQLIAREMRVADMQTADIEWDGRDDQGDAAMSGMYQIVVRLKDSSGATTYVNGKLTLIR